MNSTYNQLKINFPIIKEAPSENLKAVVVIPAFNEPDLLDAIGSLFKCKDPGFGIEIIPILNHPASADQRIKVLHDQQYTDIKKFAAIFKDHFIKLHALHPFELPDKIAGVGLARKIGMDEAALRFDQLDRNGLIFNYDADCDCNESYFKSVFDHFNDNIHSAIVSIGFAHRLDDFDKAHRDIIILYELHLRTYIGWQKYFDYPFAFQTLGSCFAVKSKAYKAQGGMNTRKAGEDFYFMHKYSKLGILSSLNRALVFPSARKSLRVPFGTGRAVYDMLHRKKQIQTYHPDAIQSFCKFLRDVCAHYKQFKSGMSYHALPMTESLKQFLEQRKLESVIQMALSNSSDHAAFCKRISQWFDPFCLMKYLHYARESEFPMMSVEEAAINLLKLILPGTLEYGSPEQLLLALREFDYNMKIKMNLAL